MWSATFLLITFALLLLPLLPSLRELKFATDVQPLKVIQAYDTEITHFADGFRVWLRKNFGHFFDEQGAFTGPVSQGTLADKTRFQIVGTHSAPSFSEKEIASATTHTLIISNAALRLEKALFYESEVYSAADIETAAHSQFRALLAEGNMMLAQDCTVLRWVHSAMSLHAADGCSLFGRASAAHEMTLGKGSQFERLHASKIIFGAAVAPIAPATGTLIALTELPHIKDRYGRHWLIDGDIDVPAHHAFDGDLVATKNIHIGAGTHIMGSLKSTGDMYLAAGSQIDGAVVSRGNIHMGHGCRIAGPVIAEDTILIEEQSVIGLAAQPTTVTAPRIRIASGVTAYGTVWADENALVLPIGVAA